MLKPETLLHNRYYIKRAIGQGGMGAVYEALDRQTKQTVAVKQTFFSGDDRLDKAFRREAHILEQLQHPALPVVIEFFADEESKYLVMQFVPGDDLGLQLKAQDEPFDPATVLVWSDQLLSVLEYLHTQSPAVIHRDIKPQNIKLTHTGDIILLDFGLAKGMSVQDGSTSKFTTIMGYTPSFASLEQRRGQPTDARSDLYSLAATVYQLLTNVTPIDAMERAAELGVKAIDPLPPVKQINPRIPGAVSDLLMQTLRLNPEDRPQSAAAMRAVLKAAWQSSRMQAAEKTVIEPRVETDTAPLRLTEGHQYSDETIRDPIPDSSPVLEPSQYETRRLTSPEQIETRPGSTLPEPSVANVDTKNRKRRRPSYKAWSVILGFGFVAVIAGSFLWSTTSSRPTTTRSAPPSSSPSSQADAPAAASNPSSHTSPSERMLAARSEYLRYYLEAETATGASSDNGLDALPTGQFKFHFRSPQSAFLYIVWTSASNSIVGTSLTNVPSEDTGITTNKLAANADFVFPSNRWMGISKADSPVRYTIILSSSPITELKFLDAPPLRALNAVEQTALATYLEKHSNKDLETKREGNFAVVTAQSGNTDPLIFDIVIKL